MTIPGRSQGLVGAGVKQLTVYSKVSENQGVFAKEVEMSVTCIPILAGIFIEKYLKDSQFMGLFCYCMLYSHSRWHHHRAGHQVP